MKKKIILSLFLVFCYTKNNSQNGDYDYNADLFLLVNNVGFGNLCGYYAPNHNPGDIVYKNSGYIDLNKLYTTPYRTNTFFNNRNQTYWSTFGGFGHPTKVNTGFMGEIDDNKRDNVANGVFGVGLLKFTNVKVQGPKSTWKTAIWMNVFSQCHNSCNQGTWWKFISPNLSADESRTFAIFHNVANNADQYVNGNIVNLTLAGNPSCNASAVYGFGPGELR
jgi:hypothetical protein